MNEVNDILPHSYNGNTSPSSSSMAVPDGCCSC